MTPLVGRRRNSVAELELPGDFCFWDLSADGTTGFLAFKCPCGTTRHEPDQYDSVPVRLVDEKEKPHWKWDGNLDAPTLWPSILRLDICHWHGYLTRGVWQLERGDV